MLLEKSFDLKVKTRKHPAAQNYNNAMEVFV